MRPLVAVLLAGCWSSSPVPDDTGRPVRPDTDVVDGETGVDTGEVVQTDLPVDRLADAPSWSLTAGELDPSPRTEATATARFLLTDRGEFLGDVVVEGTDLDATYVTLDHGIPGRMVPELVVRLEHVGDGRFVLPAGFILTDYALEWWRLGHTYARVATIDHPSGLLRAQLVGDDKWFSITTLSAAFVPGSPESGDARARFYMLYDPVDRLASMAARVSGVTNPVVGLLKGPVSSTSSSSTQTQITYQPPAEPTLWMSEFVGFGPGIHDATVARDVYVAVFDEEHPVEGGIGVLRAPVLIAPEGWEEPVDTAD